MSILIGNDTIAICQGFTGSQATLHCEQAIEYGTNLVGGVTPGKAGERHLDRPVFGDVKSAVEKTKANTSIIFVPAKFCKDSINEALDAGIISGGKGTANEKFLALENAGVVTVKSPALIGKTISDLLNFKK